MRYTLETNILINMVNRYPRDLFASLWESMEGAVASGEICVCEVILKELGRGDDNLAPWVKSVPGFVCKTTDDELITAAGISSAHPDWVRGQKNYGDPFIIAHAKAEGSIIEPFSPGFVSGFVPEGDDDEGGGHDRGDGGGARGRLVAGP